MTGNRYRIVIVDKDDYKDSLYYSIDVPVWNNGTHYTNNTTYITEFFHPGDAYNKLMELDLTDPIFREGYEYPDIEIFFNGEWVSMVLKAQVDNLVKI